MPNLVAIFVSSTYLTITSEVCIGFGYVLAHMSKIVKSIYVFNNMLVVRLTYVMWQSYLFMF